MAVYKNDPNLEGLWLFEETGGTRYDDTDNSNDLADNNTVGYSSDSKEGDNSADFEAGNSEYLSIADVAQAGLDITGDISICAWVKAESVTGYHFIAGKWNDGSNESYSVYRSSTSSCIVFDLSNDGSSETVAKAAVDLSVGTWMHVAYVYNGTDMRIYIDGALSSNGADNPKTYSGGIYNSTAPFCIGAGLNGGSPSFYFDGLIDEVAVFSRALSADEVEDIYLNGIQDALAGNPHYAYAQQ